MLYYFVYFLMLAYTIFISRRTLHMLQQNLYNENNRYIKWILKNNEITIFNVSLIAIVLSIGITIFKNINPYPNNKHIIQKAITHGELLFSVRTL